MREGLSHDVGNYKCVCVCVCVCQMNHGIYKSDHNLVSNNAAIGYA